MTVPEAKAPANYVPAAAVIRRGKRYPDLLGVKGRRRHCKSEVMKARKLNPGTAGNCRARVLERQAGIPSVAVKCVDIREEHQWRRRLAGQ